MKGGIFIKHFKEIILVTNLLFTLSLLGIIFYKFYYLDFFYEDENEIAYVSNEELFNEKKEDNTKFNVEIKGPVENPGVYSFDKESIVNDLVTLSGGFKENAYTKNINLSMKLEDEMVVYVFSKKEYESLNIKEEKKPTKIVACKCPEVDISSCTKNGQSIISKSNGISNAETKTDNTTNSNEIVLVNINTANIEELTLLSGIGESKAKSIIEYRETNGNFQSIEDIVNVSGISENTYEKIKDYITV